MSNYDRCGDCKLWMTQQCPREPGDRAKKIYNSCGAVKCTKFDRSDWSVRLEQIDIAKKEKERLDEIRRREREAILLSDLFKHFS